MVTRIIGFTIALLMVVNVYANPDIEHWQTSNGGRVYFVSAPDLPMVDISVVFDAGAARDGDASGLALLTNAMLNEGADGVNADQLAAAFEDVGAQFSHSSERDMAVLSLRSLTTESAFNSALQTFIKVLTKPDFPQTSFERLQKQMLIGLQAEKQSPAAIASRAFYGHLYGNHPYASMPAGDETSVAQLTPESLKTFYKQYYVAKNAVIGIVGALDKSQAKEVAEQILSTLTMGEAAKPLANVEAITTLKQVVIEHPSTQTHILMGQPGMSREDPDYFALYVGNHILGGSGLVSQLSNEVREKRGLSYSVYSYFRPMRELGPYQFGLQTRNGKTEEALEVMRSTLKAFIENGPTEAELEAAKQNITGGFALRIDSNKKIADYLAMIGFYGLPLDYLDTFKSHVNAVTAEQIKQAYTRRINPDKMITVLVGGKAE
ncbi:MAG: insulinase family protein [Gammaproteobacteria bacterium]|nr:insulinase family protein [Gammaproteobacteria bacterium]MDH5592108.1 insulinase family protein [Gammaproteobacteria bacterium]